jgi:hypothetical protein
VKSRATLALDVASMSATDPGWLSHVTVCATDWKCQVTVAVPPDRATVTVLGSNANPDVAVTLPVAVGGGGGPVVLPLLPPHANIDAAKLPAAMVRTTLRSMV